MFGSFCVFVPFVVIPDKGPVAAFCKRLELLIAEFRPGCIGPLILSKVQSLQIEIHHT